MAITNNHNHTQRDANMLSSGYPSMVEGLPLHGSHMACETNSGKYTMATGGVPQKIGHFLTGYSRKKCKYKITSRHKELHPVQLTPCSSLVATAKIGDMGASEHVMAI